MPVKTNTVTTSSMVSVRAVDFVTRFSREIKILNDIMGSVRMERKAPGTKLVAKKAEVTLNTSSVSEGDEIPYNVVNYTEVDLGTIEFDKQAIGVTLEAIAKSGYDVAVQKADDDMLYKMENKIVTAFMNFIQTGTLTSTYATSDFQSAVAEAIGQVSNKWENMNRGYSQIIGFCNTLDVYRYLGSANITVQREFGMDYIKDFMGFSKLFMTSKIPSGKVFATPAENIVLYYIDVTDSDFNKAGFDFVTDGETNLVGVDISNVSNRMVSEMVMVYGIGLFAEYLDGIANIQFSPSISLDYNAVSVTAASGTNHTKQLTATVVPSNASVTWTSSATGKATVSNTGLVTGVAAGSSTITASITEGGKTYTATCVVTVT